MQGIVATWKINKQLHNLCCTTPFQQQILIIHDNTHYLMAEADSNLSRTATTQVHSVLHGNNPSAFSSFCCQDNLNSHHRRYTNKSVIPTPTCPIPAMLPHHNSLPLHPSKLAFVAYPWPQPLIVFIILNTVYLCVYTYVCICVFIFEGSLEVKLPTIWTDEKQRGEEAERRERLEERSVEEKE